MIVAVAVVVFQDGILIINKMLLSSSLGLVPAVVRAKVSAKRTDMSRLSLY